MTWPIIAILLFLLLFALLAITVFARRDQQTGQLALVYYEDGLWDIYLGVLLLLLGIAEWVEASWAGLIPVLLYPLLLATKRAITEPRLRPDDMPPPQSAQRKKLTMGVVGMFLLFGLLLAGLLMTQPPAWLAFFLQTYLVLTLLLLVVAFFAILGWRTGAMRLFAYAGLFLAALLVSYWVEVPLFVYALTLGSIILVIGLALTVKFVQHHPKMA